MTIETELAKRGAKLTWEGAKVVVFAILLFAATGAVIWLIWGQRQRDKRLEGLETFRQSVETQDRVSAAADAAYTWAKQERDQQSTDQVKVVIEHEKATEEARREDPTVDDFLRARIPERLRDADARARRSGRLEEDRARR